MAKKYYGKPDHLKYDYLRVVCDLCLVNEDYSEHANEKYFNFKVYVNDIYYDGYIDIETLFLDTHLQNNPLLTIHYNDWLTEINGRYSTVYLNSCSCGHAGCSGYWSGVKIHKKKKCMKYSCKTQDGYSNGILGSGKNNLYIGLNNLMQMRSRIADYVMLHPDVEPELTNFISKWCKLNNNYRYYA